MTTAPRPKDETERLAVLREMEILDTPSEAVFDGIVQVASWICGAPIALISLVDAERQWFKARVGLDAAETSRDVAFCAHAILAPEIMIVRDALADPRFADNPLVAGSPGIRFYAAAPLLASGGQVVGTVCVIDTVPRDLSPEQTGALRSLAEAASAHLELRREAAALGRAEKRATLAQKAEAEARAQLLDLLDGANDLIQSVAPDGQILFVNQAWKTTLGYSDSEIADLRLFEIIAPESQEHCLRELEKVMAGQSLSRVEATFIARDGRRVFLNGSSTCKIVDGRPVHTRSVFRDVTDQRAAEAAKTEFLASAATDLRAPLMAIKGALDILQDYDLPAGASDVFHIAQTSTDRLLRQLQDVLDLAEIQAGRFRLRRSDAKAAALLQDALARVRSSADRKGVELVTELVATPALLIDPAALSQVLVNLASYAVDHSIPGEVVTARLDETVAGDPHFSITYRGDELRSDEAAVMFAPPERRPPGSRHDTAASLKMAVSKAIVDAHRGEIGVEPRPGGGARLWLTLPAAPAT